ncbi:MAG: radical SAM protein, partial [Nitrospirota bacterium]
MQSRLLIINCPSEYFVYIPMGTFGICDYLDRKKIQVRLLNLALYNLNSNPPLPPFAKGGHRGINNKAEIGKVLEHYLDLFRPTYVGLIFHWQDTAEGFLWVGEYIKSCADRVKIISGGLTAGYFGENLLERCRFVDYVIKGDPEKPLELLIGGAEPSEIPNLIYRNRAGIVSNEVSYCIDQETISSISFCKLNHLYDYELYIEAVERKLGFPLFIGRGCSFSCHYCGGSSGSFRLHSGRVRPVVRSIDSIIADLKRLKDFTRNIYICYENDRDYIKALFKEMKKEKNLAKIFHLNYGAWQLLDREFLELYEDLFTFPKGEKPLLELSPEVFNDQSRKKIRHPSVNFSIKDLRENLYLINSHLGESVNVSIFFSRYHDTHRTYQDIKKEIIDIFRLKHDLFCNNITNVNVCYDHLSTDVASCYWEGYIDHPRVLDTLISAMKKIKAFSFPVDNLCIYIPETLSGEEILKCELLIFILKSFERYFHELFHTMFKCLDKLTIDLIEEIIIGVYLNRTGNVFVIPDWCEFLNYVKQKITQKESLLSKLPFIEDLTGLCVKKVIGQRRPQPARDPYRTKRPMLN